MRAGRTPSTLVALALLAAGPLVAQPASIVADLGGPVTFHWDDWIETNDIVEAGGLLYFFQNDGSNGRELWRSDGTSLGTFMVRDLCPGACGSRSWYPGQLAVVGERLFFAANDGVHGFELWVTDGSALGTRQVVDLAPGWRSSGPHRLTSAAGQLFFVADFGGGYGALYRTDGTAKGTVRLSPLGEDFNLTADIYEGPGFLYVANNSNGPSRGLWRSDGTQAGTFLLTPLESFYYYWFWHGRQGALLPGGELLFSARGAPGGGAELWISDGTPAGTARLLDIFPGDADSIPRSFSRLGDEVVFVANNEDGIRLFRSNGTPGGTQVVPLPPGVQPAYSPAQFAGTLSRYYFAASAPNLGIEPWVFDGETVANLADIAPGPASSLAADLFDARYFVPMDGVLILSADDGVHGLELWRSDGSGPGTFRLTELGAASASMVDLSYYASHRPVLLGDSFYFFDTSEPTSYRLFRTDGLTPEPELVRNIDHQTSTFEPLSRDRGSLFDLELGRECFAVAGDHLFFERFDRLDFVGSLWTSDASSAGTQLAYPGSSYSLSPCSVVGDQILFPESKAIRSLGPGGTPPELVVEGNLQSTIPKMLPTAEGPVFALYLDGLFQSDGTAGGTVQLGAEPLAERPVPWLAAWNDSVLYGGPNLWVTHPGEPSPVLLTESNGIDQVEEIATLGASILFVATDASHGAELWASDGLPGGASLLADIRPGPAGSLARPPYTDGLLDTYVPRILALPSAFVLSADDGTHGLELWVSDGTPLGTHLLKDIFPGSYPSTPRNLTRFGNRIFFTAEGELEGLELWATDGTAAGTIILKDIAPGGASSIPDDLAVRDGVLYFSAWSPDYGREAWMSDGTALGTIRITDAAPGPASSSPQRFNRMGDKLLFTATDQIHGYELWAIQYDSSSPLFVDGFEAGSAIRWSAIDP